MFKKISGFCTDCGSILPPLRDIGGVACYACKRLYQPDDLTTDQNLVKYSIIFNSRTSAMIQEQQQQQQMARNEEEGPVVDRKCSKCGNETMSYATLQLRSADEGQTVFYTCTKCQYKETENS